MLKVGEIIKGPFWPEIVEIKNCEKIDEDLYQVEAIGRKTNKYYDRYIEKYQLEQLETIKQEDSFFQPERLQHYLQYYILTRVLIIQNYTYAFHKFGHTQTKQRPSRISNREEAAQRKNGERTK